MKQATDPRRTRVWLADGALVACAFFWGLGFVAMKRALSVYPAFWLLFLRFGGGALLLGASLRLFFRADAGLSWEDLAGGLVMGVFLFLAMGLQTLGLNHTTAGKQAFLTASYVILAPFVLWGARRVFPGWASLAGALVCFSGMGFLTSGLTGALNRGDVLTVISAFFFAAQIVATERYATQGDPLRLTLVQFCVTAALSLCGALVFEGPFVPRGWKGLGSVTFATVVCTFLCFLIQNVGQKYTPAAHASILLGLESVFGALSGVVFLNEVFTPQMTFGCVLIFAAVLLVEFQGARSSLSFEERKHKTRRGFS
ncbi:MAG: DMT family transporter [Synergistaceae bacterium]|jgi:drug/metabolite transporter (DMT)-like permease|nr:DMT family transporter [Synergistaceae bacterium]